MFLFIFQVNNIAIQVNFSNNAPKRLKVGGEDGGGDGDYISIDFVEISKICSTRDAFFFETEPFDRVNGSKRSRAYFTSPGFVKL